MNFWIRQYPYKSQLFCVIDILGHNSCHNSQTIIPTDNFQKIILTHSRGFSFLTFLCALFSGSGDFTRIHSQRGTVRAPSLFYTRAWHKLGEALGRVGFTLRAFHLTIPLSLSPLYPSLSLSLSLPLSIPLSLSFSPSLYLSLLSLPPSLYLSFYLSLSLFPSLSLLFIILFGVSNGRFRPCYLTSV